MKFDDSPRRRHFSVSHFVKTGIACAVHDVADITSSTTGRCGASALDPEVQGEIKPPLIIRPRIFGALACSAAIDCGELDPDAQ